MDLIIDTIMGAIQQNLVIMILLLLVVASLQIINIVLGTILGTKLEGFNWQKFLFGFVKALIAGICIFAFCYVLNLFAITLGYIDVEISTDVISTLEVLGVSISWALDLSKEILDKIKSLKELKYDSYDDVKVLDDGYGEELG